MAKDLKTRLAAKMRENTERHASATQDADIDFGKRYAKIPIDKIDPNPYQPRKTFPAEQLQELAGTIQASGQIQPISVREIDGRYQLIAGERRWRAHQLLERTHIEAIIGEATDAEMAVLALAENIGRQDLCDYEKACGIQRVEELFPNRKNLAESLGLGRQDLYRYIAFLELPQYVIARLEHKPALFARSAAELLRKTLKRHENHPDLQAAVTHALDALETGRLDQLKIAQFIDEELKERSDKDDRVEPQEIVSNGVAVGKVQRTARSLVLTLNTKRFGVEQQARLLAFVNELASEGG